MSSEGGSAHEPQDHTEDPSTFNIKVLPAGSAPKNSTFKPNVGGEPAPGQANNVADTKYDDKTEVYKGLGGDAVDASEGKPESHHVEIKSATEMEPMTADML